MIDALEAHRAHQAIDRETAENLWHDDGWIFTNLIGQPVHPD